MHRSRSCMILPAKKFSFCTRCFSLAIATLLLVSSLLLVGSPAHGAQTHSCAPDPPAPISGAVMAPSTPGSVMINEVLSLPHATWNCSEPSGVYSQGKDSWIELYNTQNQPLDLYAAHAEFSIDGGQNWLHLPFGSAIAPNGFLVVFLFENQQTTPVTSPWTLILAIGGAVIDQATIPALQPDQSYARIPDGSSNWQYVGQPTIDASNDNSNQPITPTPTKTPKTPTPTKTPKPSSGGGTGGSGGANAPISSGTQPAWSGVQLPAGGTPVPVATDSTAPATQLLSQSQTQNAPVSQSSGQDSWWHGIVLIMLVSLLLIVLVCCWRLFHTP